jgi:hypothetical protein
VTREDVLLDVMAKLIRAMKAELRAEALKVPGDDPVRCGPRPRRRASLRRRRNRLADDGEVRLAAEGSGAPVMVELAPVLAREVARVMADFDARVAVEPDARASENVAPRAPDDRAPRAREDRAGATEGGARIMPDTPAAMPSASAISGTASAKPSVPQACKVRACRVGSLADRPGRSRPRAPAKASLEPTDGSALTASTP